MVGEHLHAFFSKAVESMDEKGVAKTTLKSGMVVEDTLINWGLKVDEER